MYDKRGRGGLQIYDFSDKGGRGVRPFLVSWLTRGEGRGLKSISLNKFFCLIFITTFLFIHF